MSSSLIQLQNGEVLGDFLGLKPVQSSGQLMPGSPIKYEITDETVKKIKSLVGKTVAVEGDGKLVRQ